jgi:hypothetical protein
MKVPIAMPAVAPEERPPLSGEDEEDGGDVDTVPFGGVVGVEEAKEELPKAPPKFGAAALDVNVEEDNRVTVLVSVVVRVGSPCFDGVSVSVVVRVSVVAIASKQ